MLYICFLLSGATSLIYEVTWIRGLQLVFGSTNFATSAILTAFMAGLALGAYLGGRWTSQNLLPRNLVQGYGIIEGAIGIYALVLPLLMTAVVPLYQAIWTTFHPGYLSFSLVRLVLSTLLLLLPTTAMGATLPLLSAYAGYLPESKARVPLLYGINTLGAVLGSLAAGFWLLPLLGERMTITVTACGNLAIAACMVWWSRTQPVAPPQTSASSDRTQQPAPVLSPQSLVLSPSLPWLLGLSGFLALVYEVAWTRTLVLIVGSSVYAFATMLGIFLAGLALGSLAMARPAARSPDRWLLLTVLQVGVGVTALAGMAMVPELPYLSLRLFKLFPDSYAALVALQFSASLLLMGLPTMLLGGVFAAALAECAAVPRTGEAVGRLYAANTVGAIGGALVGGFILLPQAGLAATLLGSAMSNITLGGYALLGAAAPRKWPAWAALVLLLGLGLSQPPHWLPMVMGSGIFRYADQYEGGLSRSEFLAKLARKHVLYYQEGYTTSVLVGQSGLDLFLKVNGKTDAGTSGDLATQLLLGHLPLIVRGGGQAALVIGLGSGATVGAMARWPLRRIDVAEIESSVVTAAGLFDVINGGVLADPRVHIVAEDGRNFMLIEPRRYDLIVSEPSNPWMAGVAKLYTVEAFRLGRRRLLPGGVFCQWIHTYNLHPERLQSVMAAFSSAFPHTLLMESGDGDVFLFGSSRPLSLRPERVAAALARPGVAEQLRRVKVASAADLLIRLRLGEAGIARFSGSASPNTDDNGHLEYGAPRDLYRKASQDTHKLFFAASRIPPEGADGWIWDPALHEEVAASALHADALMLAERHARAALAHGPRPLALRIMAELERRRGRVGQASAALQKALAMNPQDAETRLALARHAGEQGDFRAALRHADAALTVRPLWTEALWVSGLTYLHRQDYPSALPPLLAAARDATAVCRNPDIYQALALVYQKIGQPLRAQKARDRYQRLLRLREVCR